MKCIIVKILKDRKKRLLKAFKEKRLTTYKASSIDSKQTSQQQLGKPMKFVRYTGIPHFIVLHLFLKVLFFLL